MNQFDEYIKRVQSEVAANKSFAAEQNVGKVEELRDGVALISGLEDVSFGEVVEFEGKEKGYVIDLNEDIVGVIVLDEYEGITSGQEVKGLGYTLSVPVSDELLGRVVNPLGQPLDDAGSIKSLKAFPIEKIAPTVVYRKGVSVPLQTGIKAIDALTPIGRGQRELIIGDRGTGKTTIALDTILNQKGENVICIYCGIGQKRSKMALVVELLKKHKALDYTIVVSSSASDPTSLQYIAPYSACAIGEYFMNQGKDVLVIYDDLSKHAWAYRQISLILRKPAGREAYPGDIFYLHSRLLERACRIDEKYGGGSLTALPIVETLEGDVSAYIPTNIISITDGQIFLETELFNAGIRPAINIGISVSRVGGNAQTKAMKQVAGRLKLDLAQYREMAAFSQFESDLDEETRKLLNRGAKVTQILKQNKNNPYLLSQEIIVLWAAHKGYLDNIPLNEVGRFEEKLVQAFHLQGVKVAEEIKREKVLTEKIEAGLKTIVESIL